MVPTIILISLCLLLFFVTLTFHSLREFSRSRLESVCKQRRAEHLIGSILRKDQNATLAMELLSLLAILGIGSYMLIEHADRIHPTVVGVGFVFIGFVLPRAIALVISEHVLVTLWPVIAGLTWLMTPLLSVLEMLDTLFHRMAGREDPGENDPNAISEELRTVIDEGEREGVIESGAGRIIQRLMEIQHEDVTSVMTPRTDMVCIQVDTPIEEVRRQLIEAGHSRVPIFQESPDDLIGILYAKDLLQRLGASDEEVSIKEILREPIYIPESTGIESLLERMRGEHVHMAIVMDEYGGVTGLVTMEDILEEIVGEIEDEYDKEQEEEILQVNPGTVDVDARVHIDDLNERFHFELPEDEDYETIGGFVFTQLGKIPVAGESLVWQTLKVTVLEADKRRLIKLRIEQDENASVSV